MSLSLSHRRSLFDSLSPITGEEEAEALLSQFPAHPEDEPVTRAHLRAELTDVRAELTDVRAEIADVRADLTDLRAHVDTGLAEVRGEITDLRAHVDTGLAEVRAQVDVGLAEVQLHMSEALRTQTRWIVGVLLASLPICTGLAALVGR